ncbi:MAG: hypothetical protein ACREBG_00900 [Pyrinomonadaceae bacterium]
MKKLAILCLLATIVGTALVQARENAPADDASIQSFWEKFRTAVISGDKETVANLSQFPIGMPYGVPEVKSRAQLLRRYRQVFNGESDAAKCFRKARPEVEKQNPKEFSVGCKNAAGDEVVIYWFRFTRTGWRFTGLDNINE